MFNFEQHNLDQYIVTPQRTQMDSGRSDPGLLELLRLAESNPDISIVRVVGNTDNPSRLIVKAKSETINSLQSNFQGRLLFEKDQPLELY